MATHEAYTGIRFPDRAEALPDFAGYRIFLDPWQPLADDLRAYYEGLALRRESRVLAIHGDQGTGKTLFATKLRDDFVVSKEAGGDDTPDANNLWHRITGGPELSDALITTANTESDLLLIENEAGWVRSTADWIAARKDRRCVVIGDNAERPYFRQGLVEMSDAEFVQFGNSPEATKLAAQRFVEHLRSDLRGALFVLLSNDEVFLLTLDEAVAAQHAGLLTLTQLPLADARTKETVVRVNTNRLNPVSYWFCIDKAGPREKTGVKQALEGASNFPDSFAAVDTAVRSRTGRPARQNVITLIVLAAIDSAEQLDSRAFGALQRTEAHRGWFTLHVYNLGWAPAEMGTREASLLESEWVLRVAIAGVPFVQSLIEIAEDGTDKPEHIAACARLLAELRTFQGPGTRQATREAYRTGIEEIVADWPSSDVAVEPFWEQGIIRARTYEAALKELLPGYNLSGEGFLTYRPDYVVSPFRPCSVVEAISDDTEAITSAIRRDAHVFEFTAVNAYSAATIRSYLTSKLPNYVEVTQEQ